MTTTDDKLELNRDVALVLFELLSRSGAAGVLRPADASEQRALWDLEAALERVLPEPFLPNYRKLLNEAKQRLGVPGEDVGTKPPELVVFVDVDDTLVRSAGPKRIPIAGVVQRVRDLYSTGAKLYCWSTAGSRYAQETAVELGIGDCFADFLTKPHVMVDDQQPSEWKNLLCLHPNEASSMSVSEIEEAARRSTR